ncbi:MAG: hypothetical protein IJS20_06530 [Bacteroidales bacterium]|nr:hypothetical protein [Bacteroidales bacterium]
MKEDKELQEVKDNSRFLFKKHFFSGGTKIFSIVFISLNSFIFFFFNIRSSIGPGSKIGAEESFFGVTYLRFRFLLLSLPAIT